MAVIAPCSASPSGSVCLKSVDTVSLLSLVLVQHNSATFVCWRCCLLQNSVDGSFVLVCVYTVECTSIEPQQVMITVLLGDSGCARRSNAQCTVRLL